MEMYATGKWNDQACSLSRQYVCEWDEGECKGSTINHLGGRGAKRKKKNRSELEGRGKNLVQRVAEKKFVRENLRHAP